MVSCNVRRAVVAAAGMLGGGWLSKAARAADAAPTPPATLRLPEKSELLLQTDRPPNLETPLRYFREDLTPNEAFYVRWHLAVLPTTVDPADVPPDRSAGTSRSR